MAKRAPLDDDQKQARIQELYDKYRQSFQEVPSVTVEEVLERREAGERLVFVDVRRQEERDVSMIPAAVTTEELESNPDAYRGATLITYCTIGYRSGLYARNLLARGWRAENMEGAILSWTHAGQPLEDDGAPTHRVHVYGRDWSLEASKYEPVW